MRNRWLMALGTPMFMIFGYPALTKPDTPTYYGYVSIVGLIMIFVHFIVRARRYRKRK